MKSDFKNSDNVPFENDQEAIEITNTQGVSDAIEEDGTPVLDEEDLEENDISTDDAEDIEWDPAKENVRADNAVNTEDKSTSGGGKNTNNGGKPASGLKRGKGITTGSKGTSGN